MRPRTTLTWLILLVLVSAAGLLGVGVVNLWQALRSADATARLETRKAAQSTADAVRLALERQEVLEVLPASRRFELDTDGIVVPPELAWVKSPRATRPMHSMRLAQVLDRAESLEFGSKKAGAAAELLEKCIQQFELNTEERQVLLTRAAWSAHRRNATELRDRYTQELLEEADRLDRTLRPSVLLLLASSGKALPSWTEACLIDLEAKSALALLDRLRELGTDNPGISSPSLDALALGVREARTLRGTLIQAAGQQAELLERRSPLIRSLGAELLIWFPRTQGGGTGAVLPHRELLEILRVATDPSHGRSERSLLAPISWSGRLHVGPTAGPDAIALWPDSWIVPTQEGPATTLSRPWLLGLLLLALTLSLVLGVALLFRGVRQEQTALLLHSEFLTSVTHELRTPLASIRMFSEMLEGDRIASEERRREYYRLLAGEAGRLSTLVENVLDLGRMERGERSYDLRTVELNSVVEEAVDIFVPIAEEMEVRFEPSPGVRVSADSAAMRQALLNLMDNSRKYAKAGRLLTVEVDGDSERARVRIRDRGPGIRNEERERIFERFVRGEGQKAGTVPGVGLGLYLARRILRAHGGELQSISCEGPGACFVLELPIANGERR